MGTGMGRAIQCTAQQESAQSERDKKAKKEKRVAGRRLEGGWSRSAERVCTPDVFACGGLVIGTVGCSLNIIHFYGISPCT